MKLALTALTLTAAFALGGAAYAATGWHVFATGSDSGQYGAFASANADVVNPSALAIRVTKEADLTWSLDCQGELKHAAANAIVAISVTAADKCSLNGSANTSTDGTLKVQLLKR